MEIIRDLSHIKAENGFRLSVAAGVTYVIMWSEFFSAALAGVSDASGLEQAIETANLKAGVRCLAAEVLLSGYCEHLTIKKKIFIAMAVADAGLAARDPESVAQHVGMLNYLRAGVGEMLRWVVAPMAEFNLYSFQCDYPSIHFVPTAGGKPAAANPTPGFSGSCKSIGQRNALETLTQIASVRRQFEGAIAGVPIRASALLVGMSGAGKTFVANAFASAAGWPFYSTTAGGWVPNSAKAEPWTLVEIQRRLSKSPLVIFVDEVDKIQTASQGADNYHRACQTEVMMLLDRHVPDIGMTATQADNLRESWILTAGAFQQIFKDKIGERIHFPEEVGNMRIEREDLEAHSGLPTELLNRVGPVIHVAPPTPMELAEAYEAIELATGQPETEKERMARARDAVVGLKGFRGLEEYAFFCGRKSLGRASRKKRKTRSA